MAKAIGLGTQLYGVSHMPVAHDSICFAHITSLTQMEAGNHQKGTSRLVDRVM